MESGNKAVNSRHSKLKQVNSGTMRRTKSNIHVNQCTKEPVAVQKHDPDEMYNVYMASIAAKLLVKKSGLGMQRDIDRQLATLQNRVKENLNALEETKLRIGAVHLMKDQKELLAYEHSICENMKDEPTFIKGKNFTDLMSEIDQIRDQLPSKGVCVPDTRNDIVELQSATSQLLQSLDRMCAEYGAEHTLTAAAASNLQEIEKFRRVLVNNKKSVNSVLPKTSACTMEEVVSVVQNVDLYPNETK